LASISRHRTAGNYRPSTIFSQLGAAENHSDIRKSDSFFNSPSFHAFTSNRRVPRINESEAAGAVGKMGIEAQSRDILQSRDFIKTIWKFPQKNLETQRSFASEIEIDNIEEESQNLNFDPEEIKVTQQMSDEDFKAEIALVTAAPKVMTSSAETVTSPDFAEEETEEQVKTILPLISYTEDEEEVKPIYEFDFSWMAWKALRGSLMSLGTREVCELELFKTKFRNAEMAKEYDRARVGGMTGYEFEERLHKLMLDKTIISGF
jgi:hypothetical protein